MHVHAVTRPGKPGRVTASGAVLNHLLLKGPPGPLYAESRTRVTNYSGK